MIIKIKDLDLFLASFCEEDNQIALTNNIKEACELTQETLIEFRVIHGDALDYEIISPVLQ